MDLSENSVNDPNKGLRSSEVGALTLTSLNIVSNGGSVNLAGDAITLSDGTGQGRILLSGYGDLTTPEASGVMAVTSRQDGLVALDDVVDGYLPLRLVNGYDPGQSPDQNDSYFARLFHNNGNVWLTIPAMDPILIKEAPPTPPNPNLLHVETDEFSDLVGNVGGPPFYELTFLGWLDPGIYRLTISADNFVTANWGSHSLTVTTISTQTLFYNPINQSLYGITGNNDTYSEFYLPDPSQLPGPYEGSVDIEVTGGAVMLRLSGTLPAAYDNVDITFTLTPM